MINCDEQDEIGVVYWRLCKVVDSSLNLSGSVHGIKGKLCSTRLQEELSATIHSNDLKPNGSSSCHRKKYDSGRQFYTQL